MVPVLTSRKASELPISEVACALQVRARFCRDKSPVDSVDWTWKTTLTRVQLASEEKYDPLSPQPLNESPFKELTLCAVTGRLIYSSAWLRRRWPGGECTTAGTSSTLLKRSRYGRNTSHRWNVKDCLRTRRLYYQSSEASHGWVGWVCSMNQIQHFHFSCVAEI